MFYLLIYGRPAKRPAKLRAGREIIIIRLKRLGWTQEQIAKVVGISQGRVAQIINNTNFGEINNLLTQGREMTT